MNMSAKIVFLALLDLSMTIAGYSTGAMAQSVNIQPGSSPDMRVAYATPQDAAEGKRVAETMCVKCHGLNGISTIKGVPHLAGQRPVYMHQELKIYQTGARGTNAMSETVKYMNDDALMKVAAYYASLDPADPSVPSGKAAPAKPDPVAAGRGAAAGCAGCHGDIGISKTPGMPSLVGLDPKYFTAAISAYKSGQRKHDMMKTLVSGLGDADLANVALFYAMQKPAKAQTPAPGNATAGKTAAAGCVGCHGEGGVSGNPSTPSIAGQDAQYFIAAMRAYKDGSRNDATMKGVAGSLDEPTLKDLAAYYASQQPQRPNVAKPLTPAEWAQRCDRCHGANGNSTDPRSPALAAQRVDYLEKVLHAYKKGERKSKEMAVMSEGLDDALVNGLALHYARQKAKGAVYVMLPAAAK
jgi:cytochrome c553